MKSRVWRLVFGMFLCGQMTWGQSTFTKITTGDVVTDLNDSMGCAWGDFDGDGWIDLFVANMYGQANGLYRNNRDGTFAKITTGPVATDGGDSCTGVWADYDNDGDLDLYVTNFDPPADFFYRNNGDATFTKVAEWVDTTARGVGGAWGDYDNDGYVDLVFAADVSLYRNLGNGTMAKVLTDPFHGTQSSNDGCAWGDWDGDGDLDLALDKGPGLHLGILLFQNNGDGTFQPPVSLAEGTAVGLAWGDYNNDSLLDLYVANLGYTPGERNQLFSNTGSGSFCEILEGPHVNDVELSTGCAWGDYDNDGFLDLFVANASQTHNDSLYRSNGDGTFSKVTDIDPVMDGAESLGCAWGDYDNDGDLDLYVATGWISPGYPPEANLLYRNDGNANHWLIVRLVGTASNRSAIGAKARARATILGQELWQSREISGGSGYCSQNDLRAHFGLGDAARVDLLRIEWPSGIVQELTNVVANQILTVTEHQAGATSAPNLTASKAADGTLGLTATGQTNLRYVFEASTNLVQWTKIAVRTNLTGTVDFTPAAASSPQRFYRVQVP